MARMSIDDALLRDPRVKDLAERIGWHRHQVIGCLLDVWAVCYDRVSPVLTQREVDFACEVSGFCALMIATKLAAETGDEDGSVRVAGVAKRIGYLESSAERGREGGKKSGESRRTKGKSKGPAKGDAKGSFDSGEGSPNPLPSASAPDTASASVAPTGNAPTLTDRQRARSALWREHQDARQALGRELGIVAPAFAPFDRGEEELASRLLEATQSGEGLEAAVARCRHVLAVVTAECREARNLNWLDGQLWRKDRFDRAAARPAPRALRVVANANSFDPMDFVPRRDEVA
jgi:hypothetical protein